MDMHSAHAYVGQCSQYTVCYAHTGCESTASVSVTDAAAAVPDYACAYRQYSRDPDPPPRARVSPQPVQAGRPLCVPVRAPELGRLPDVLPVCYAAPALLRPGAADDGRHGGHGARPQQRRVARHRAAGNSPRRVPTVCRVTV